MIEIYIGFAVVGLFIVQLMVTKVSDNSIPSDLYKTDRKVNELYKAHTKPLCEEYSQLKGYESFEQFDDLVRFGTLRVVNDYSQFYTQEQVLYKELPAKLEQLKKDMKRGCEIYCKEN